MKKLFLGILLPLTIYILPTTFTLDNQTNFPILFSADAFHEDDKKWIDACRFVPETNPIPPHTKIQEAHGEGTCGDVCMLHLHVGVQNTQGYFTWFNRWCHSNPLPVTFKQRAIPNQPGWFFISVDWPGKLGMEAGFEYNPELNQQRNPAGYHLIK